MRTHYGRNMADTRPDQKEGSPQFFVDLKLLAMKRYGKVNKAGVPVRHACLILRRENRVLSVFGASV